MAERANCLECAASADVRQRLIIELGLVVAGLWRFRWLAGRATDRRAKACIIRATGLEITQCRVGLGQLLAARLGVLLLVVRCICEAVGVVFTDLAAISPLDFIPCRRARHVEELIEIQARKIRHHFTLVLSFEF